MLLLLNVLQGRQLFPCIHFIKCYKVSKNANITNTNPAHIGEGLRFNMTSCVGVKGLCQT